MNIETEGRHRKTARRRYQDAALLACTALVAILPGALLAQEAANTNSSTKALSISRGRRPTARYSELRPDVEKRSLRAATDRRAATALLFSIAVAGDRSLL